MPKARSCRGDPCGYPLGHPQGVPLRVNVGMVATWVKQKLGEKMKILIVGGNGTIGKKVSQHLAKKHDLVIAGRTSGDVQVEIAQSQSITAMFEAVGKVDAIVCIAGEAKWGAFKDLSEEDYHIGLNSKLMGQVNLVRIGKDYLNDGGSITLSTGILADHPVAMTASAAMVNGGVHSFAKAAAGRAHRRPCSRGSFSRNPRQIAIPAH